RRVRRRSRGSRARRWASRRGRRVRYRIPRRRGPRRRPDRSSRARGGPRPVRRPPRRAAPRARPGRRRRAKRARPSPGRPAARQPAGALGGELLALLALEVLDRLQDGARLLRAHVGLVLEVLEVLLGLGSGLRPSLLGLLARPLTLLLVGRALR